MSDKLQDLKANTTKPYWGITFEEINCLILNTIRKVQRGNEPVVLGKVCVCVCAL
jgi:hypothetical protein